MNKVSVIIPIFNAANYLSTTMECLLKQNYDDYEIVAVNDCSSDESLDVLESYRYFFEEKNVCFTVVNRDENGGLSAAINTGVQKSTGDYLCFPDADDELDPNYLSSMMDVLLSDISYKWVRCDYTIFLETENREYDVNLPKVSVYKDDFYDFISKYVAHNAWNMIVEKQYFEKCIGNEIFNSRLTQEWSLLLPLSFYSNYARCTQKLYRYHIRSKAMSSWQNDDLSKVIDHIDGLEQLNKAVLTTIDGNCSIRSNTAKTAVEMYYQLFRYKKYKEHSKKEAAERELVGMLNTGNTYVNRDICKKMDNPDVYLRLVFDVLLSGRVDASVENYEKYRSITENSYGIVYDNGGYDLVRAIIMVYGQPVFSVAYDEYDEKVLRNIPVVGLLQNSSKYRAFEDKIKAKGLVCLEYRTVRDSIRGWGYNNRERL